MSADSETLNNSLQLENEVDREEMVVDELNASEFHKCITESSIRAYCVSQPSETNT